MTTWAKLGDLEPVEHEQSSLDLADLLQGDVELVLLFVSCELPEHYLRRDMARLDRGDKPQDVTPLFADHIGSDVPMKRASRCPGLRQYPGGIDAIRIGGSRQTD